MNEYADSTDICYYTRRVLVGMVGMLGALTFMLLLAGFILWMTGNTIAFWAVVIVYGTKAFSLCGSDPTPALGTLSWVGMALIFLYNWSKNRIQLAAEQSWIANGRKLSPPKPDNALKQMYKAFKEKTCVKVKLVSDKDGTDETD
jgi:hypothetical protein